jgi:hypothetical protein
MRLRVSIHVRTHHVIQHSSLVTIVDGQFLTVMHYIKISIDESFPFCFNTIISFNNTLVLYIYINSHQVGTTHSDILTNYYY